MEKRNNNFKVAIIGSYPPPYGGISVHVQRMHHFLQKKSINHIIYTKIDTEKTDLIDIGKKKKWLLKYSLTAKENVLHFHSIDWRERVLIGMMGFFGKKVILTIHGESLNNQINQSSWLKKKILIWALKNIDNIIVVNPQIKSLLISLEVKSEMLECIPAFIPPTVKDEELAEIPQEVWAFIDNHTPVISANAFRISFYNNQDLYGIDMCIDLCANLKKHYPQIGFVFCLPDVGDYEYFNKMKQKIKEKDLGNNFLFQTKACQLYPIIMKSNIFVRPTNTDGYGVSIAEAVSFDVPAVASDVCDRPEGTILFKNRDIDDFTSKVKSVIDNYEQHKNKLKSTELENNVGKILEIYQKVAEK